MLLFPLPPRTRLIEQVAPNVIRLNHTTDFPEIDHGYEQRADYDLIGWVHGDARLAATGAMIPGAHHQVAEDHQRLIGVANRALAHWWRSTG